MANRDRHEQNWAALTPLLTSLPEKLAPSYNHASSLGFNLTDSKRGSLLQEQGALDRWARRGTAFRFEHAKAAPTLVEHARNALDLCTPASADWWTNQRATLNLQAVREPLRERAVRPRR